MKKKTLQRYEGVVEAKPIHKKPQLKPGTQPQQMNSIELLVS